MVEQESYSSKKTGNTRVKVKPSKKTVGITLPPNLVESARKHKLNISRIAEQALLSILDYMETQNRERPHSIKVFRHAIACLCRKDW